MRVALVQMSVTDEEDKENRFRKAAETLEEIEKSGKKPDLILFPELWGCGFQNFSQYKKEAENLKGETWRFMGGWAKRLRCYIHGGSFVEKHSQQTDFVEKISSERDSADTSFVNDNFAAYFNTSIFFDREGQEAGVYRKVHLFGFESLEQKILTKGTCATEADTEFGRIGMAVCYDLRFPEQFRQETKAEAIPAIFLVPAAWPQARLEHWRLFNQVRAVENQCYVISCNAAGTQCGVSGAGHSMITDPWGVVLAEGGDEEEIIWCDLDLERVSQCRNQFPALKDRVQF